MKYRQRHGADKSSGEQTAGSLLTKVTLNLLPRTVKALDELSDSTGDTRTECINRAVQVYSWLRVRIDLGDQFMVTDQDGNSHQIQIF